MRILAAFVLLALAGSASGQPAPKLDMLGFFAGRTHSDNVIRIAFKAPHKMVVDSIGGRNKEGEFVLIDTVREEGKPERKRTWVMRADGPSHYTGSLSDAKGPVDVTVTDGTANIQYVMKDGGLKIDQQLQLQRDGSVSNHTVAKKFGMKFAEVNGTIRKLD